jgi:hypothetical protein
LISLPASSFEKSPFTAEIDHAATLTHTHPSQIFFRLLPYYRGIHTRYKSDIITITRIEGGGIPPPGRENKQNISNTNEDYKIIWEKRKKRKQKKIFIHKKRFFTILVVIRTPPR